MTIDEIMEYVLHTPDNTNPSILKELLNSISSSNGDNDGNNSNNENSDILIVYDWCGVLDKTAQEILDVMYDESDNPVGMVFVNSPNNKFMGVEFTSNDSIIFYGLDFSDYPLGYKNCYMANSLQDYPVKFTYASSES